MSKITHAFALVALAGTAFLLGRTLPAGDSAAIGQDKKPAAGQPDAGGHDAKPGEHAMDPRMMPGPQHKVLEIMAGEWEGDATMWMAPGAEPMKSHGTAKREWILDGRYMHEKVEASEGYVGLGVTGYNAYSGKYEAAWIDNMNTPISWSEGTYDAAKKTFTFSGDMYNPMTGKKGTSRMTLDCSDPNREIMTAYNTGPDGKEFKAFEGVFMKKGPAPAHDHNK